MGYSIRLRNHSIFIPAADVEAATALSKSAAASGRFPPGNFTFRFDDEGNLVELDFVGDKAGWGEKEELEALAPFAQEGDFVEFEGEDNAVYRHVMRNGKVVTEYADVVYRAFSHMPRRSPDQTHATFVLQVSFDPKCTDVESLASALDTLLETAMSTPGILDEYGPVEIGAFVPEETT